MYANVQPTSSYAAAGAANCLVHPSDLENLAKQFHSQRSNQVAAFCSVQDLILASIIHHGNRATLREIYNVCILHGHIAYSRSKGSRMITQNAHWKSQIRHALYTNPRFMRCPDDADMWTMAPSMINVRPKTCIVTLDDSDDGWAIPTAPLPPPMRAPKPNVVPAVDPMMAITVPAHAKRKRSSCSRAPASCSSLDALSRQASAQEETCHVVVWQAYPNKHEQHTSTKYEEEEDDSSSQSWQPSLAALRTPLTKGVVEEGDHAQMPIGSCTPPRPPPHRCQPARWSPLQQPAIVPAARNRRKNGRVQRSAMDGDVASVC